MKKILMILDNGFKPDLRVQKEINTLIKLGYSVELFCWDQDGDMPAEEHKNNFNISRIKLVVKKQQGVKKIIDLFKFFKLTIHKIKEKNVEADYIYVHDFLLLPFGVFLKFKFNKPLIYDAHEIYHLMEWEKYNPTIRNIIFQTEKFLTKFIDAFIVVNSTRKNFYSEYFKNKIDIIGNWYDPYNGEIVELKKQYGISPDEVIISYFGVINFDERPINEIIEKLHDKKNVHFFIAGEGKNTEAVENFSKIYERVHYLGWQNNVRKYLNDVDYIVYYMNDKRKYFEYTAPNTLYLAISHGTPIITNVPGESETLIRENNIGYFIKNTENIDVTINFDLNSKEYRSKFDSINKIKDKFKWSECEKTYTDIFARITKK
jgi:hypothetical protein